MDDGRVDDGRKTDMTPDDAGDGPVAADAETSGGPTRRSAMVWVLPVIALCIVGFDQLTKVLVVHHLDPRNPIHVIGDVVTFRLVRNSGAAFSMASGYTWVLTVVALVVVAGILRYSSRLRSAWWIVGLGLVLGGALGNLVDRLFRAPGPLRGHVVDFISVGDWWPVFNVADSAVVCGAVLLVGLSLLGYEYDGSRTGWANRRHDDTGQRPDEQTVARGDDAATGDAHA